MEDHHHPHHHHSHHQYGMSELRHLMNARPTQFPHHQTTSDLFGFTLAPDHSNCHLQENLGFTTRGFHELCSDSSVAGTNAGIGAVAGVSGGGGGGAAAGAAANTGFSGLLDLGNGRWPRQETLTLLEIRSRLDHKFREANQKGPLWDEVSRIMAEEHGYQRSGKKCREKFENLYKYYKKTKEGKAGRQDGKHYRFFRQLEALYGESSNSVSGTETGQFIHRHATSNANTQPHNPEALIQGSHQRIYDNSLSFSNNSTDFDTSSSEDNDQIVSNGGLMDSNLVRRKRRSWRLKLKEFIDAQMRKLIERQEAWLEKLTKTIEAKEQERVCREEEWRKQEEARIERERKFWEKERKWIEARDAAMVEALQNLTGRQLVKASSSSPEGTTGNEIQNHSDNQYENASDQTMTTNVSVKGESAWTDLEIARLIELRRSMESRFQINGSSEGLWEEISSKMGCLGYERSPLMCKEKWECVSNFMMRRNADKDFSKKRKETSRSASGYFSSNHAQCVYNPSSGYNCEMNEQGQAETVRPIQVLNDGSSPSNSNAGNAMNSGSCFPFLMGEGDQNLWESYGLRLSNGEN